MLSQALFLRILPIPDTPIVGDALTASIIDGMMAVQTAVYSIIYGEN